MSEPIIYRDIEQHTPEWDAIRAGKWTASNAATIMSELGARGTLGKGLSDLTKSTAWGRVYGAPDEPRYQSAAMARGNELEAEARDWYAFETGRDPETVGFVRHGDIPTVGWSPDGIAPAVEIKCLLHKAYMDVLSRRKVPAEYRWQCSWACWVGGIDVIDFVAYHPAAGGIILQHAVTDDERAAMAKRVEMLELAVWQWVALLEGRK